MKKFYLLFLGIAAFSLLEGCADMLNSLREESAAIDREEGPDRAWDEPAQVHPSRERAYRGLSANNVPSYGGEHRGFGRKLASLDHEGEDDSRLEGPLGGREEGAAPPAPADYRRYTRQDFVDKDASENSLWDGQGQGNFLFSHNRRREPGDLVTADVEKELKREIQYQLWLTLPPEQRLRTRAPASKADGKPGTAAAAAGDPKAPAAANGKSTEEKNKDAAEEAAKTNMAGGGKEDDTVRMEVAEGMGNGLVRVVGQKRVIYRGVARLVEVTALVNSKDVDDNNRVKSSAFLDTKAQVIQ